MRIKPSRFNVLFTQDGKYYVSNTLSHSLVELIPEQFNMLTNGELDIFSEEEIGCLVQEGIVVDSELDEIGILRYAYDIAKHDKDYMEFVIAPTLNCNFACPYCFEKSRNNNMCQEVQNQVVYFYKRLVKHNAFKKVKIAWYGGEPLLCFDVVKAVTERLIEINQKHNINAEIVMTTNGYLLDRNIVAGLEELGFKYIQITIDGPKHVHDTRRVLRSGKGTFETIINNIQLLRGSSVEISVRINIDKENAEYYKELSKYLYGLNMPNLRCYPALVEFTPNQESCRKCKCMTAKEFGDFANNEAREYYFDRGGASLQNVTYNCGAEHFYSFVIDDLGYVYKCWNSVGYTDQALFHLSDVEAVNPIIASKYLARDPFSEVECRDCAYLPICGGGCLYDYLHNGTHTCVPERYLYKQLLFEKSQNEGGENGEGS